MVIMETKKFEEAIGLFKNIDDRIVGLHQVVLDNKTAVNQYTLDDGRIYEVPFRSADLGKLSSELLEPQKFYFPQDEQDIEEICAEMIRKMTLYLEFKEIYRYLSFRYKSGELTESDFIEPMKKILETARKQIEKGAQFAAKVAPLWFGHYVPGFPRYTGGNPYNIYGVDHKYDYLLKPDEKYMASKRDLILYIATSENPFIPSEQDIYSSSELSNILKKKSSRNVENKGNNSEVKKETLDKPNNETSEKKSEHEEPVAVTQNNQDKVSQFVNSYNTLTSEFYKYREKVSSGKYSTGEAPKLLETINHLQTQLKLLYNSISEKEYNEYFETLSDLSERLNGHIKYLNAALSIFSQPRKEAVNKDNISETKKETLDKINNGTSEKKSEHEDQVVVTQNKQENASTKVPISDRKVERTDKKLDELKSEGNIEKRKPEETNTPVQTQSERKEIDDKIAQFMQLYNKMVNEFNTYREKVKNGIYNTRDAEELQYVVQYLQRQLKLLENTISKEEYYEYYKNLKSYQERLESHLDHVKSLTSTFRR